jgi:SAM-dependent methyltransferase
MVILGELFMRECSKSIVRRLHDANYIRKYFVGHGIDIGGKPDPLELYVELFPLCKSIRTWDWEDGDAQHMASVVDSQFDFVFSSHCIEHMVDPKLALKNWIRIVKLGGYLILTLPDEDLYEQGVFPSTFNRDHKWTFTIAKRDSWSNKSISLLHFLDQFISEVEIHRIEQINFDYRYDLPRCDRSIFPVGECAIELVLRKRQRGGQYVPTPGPQPSAHLRRYYNQYSSDRRTVIESNSKQPPFSDETEI